MRRWLASTLLVLACADDQPAPKRDATSTGGPDPTGMVGGSDATGAGEAEPCVDDYDGHHGHGTALDLALDTTSAATIVLGDGAAEAPVELGADQLEVCAATPSDFFAFEAQCPGRLAVELRTIEGPMPDLVLHNDAGQLVEQVAGAWSRRFHLKPMQRRVDAGVHVIEVRHGGGEATRYSLSVMVLPSWGCR